MAAATAALIGGGSVLLNSLLNKYLQDDPSAPSQIPQIQRMPLGIQGAGGDSRPQYMPPPAVPPQQYGSMPRMSSEMQAAMQRYVGRG